MADGAGEAAPGQKAIPIGSADRIPLAQAQARYSLVFTALFISAAIATAVLGTGDGHWVPVHLFAAGAMVGAIGGVTSLFTVSWSAAPAPRPSTMWWQRILCAVGAVGVVSARTLQWPDALLWGSAALFVAGLVALGVVLVGTVRRGVKRRFDTAVGWYVAAIAAGIAAALAGSSYATVGTEIGQRSAHVVLNLLGFVGLIIAGTLPTFIATLGRTKQSPRSTDVALRALLGVQGAAVATAAVGYLLDQDAVASVGLAAYGGGLAFLATRLPFPTRRSLTWAGPRLVALWAGMAWWLVAVVATAAITARGDLPFVDDWSLVLVVAAYGQILWGSLAYLLPVLRAGGHVLLSQGFAALWSWPGLVMVNAAGLAWVAQAPEVARVAVAVWLVDSGSRVARFVNGGNKVRRSAGDH